MVNVNSKDISNVTELLIERIEKEDFQMVEMLGAILLGGLKEANMSDYEIPAELVEKILRMIRQGPKRFNFADQIENILS